MKYWSSSRVGAVPVGGGSSSNKSSTSSSKQTKRSQKRKGITMEDLKKQTAMRLAQEQSRGEKPSGAGAVVENPVPHRFHSPSNVPSPYRRTAAGPPPPPVNTPDRSSYANTSYGDHSSVGSLPGYPEHHHHHRSPAAPPATQAPAILPTTTQNFSASHSVDSATEMGANPKLPHGLTVQELKEMTKARLQAEAGAGVDQSQQTFVPLDSGAPSSSSVPSTVRVRDQPQHPPPSSMRPSASPIPITSSSSSSFRPTTRSPYLDTSAEAWENASVSTSASDYPESVYSNTNNNMTNSSFTNEEAAIPFARSASYPHPNHSNNNLHRNDWQRDTTTTVPAAPVGNGGGGGPATTYNNYDSPNRRRAATLSPRPGSLSYVVHGDRPVLPIPSLQRGGAGAGARPGLQPLHRSEPHMVGVIGGCRARTSSTTSLPPISHTAEEFSISSSARRLGLDGVREEDAAILTEVVGGETLFGFQEQQQQELFGDGGGGGRDRASTDYASFPSAGPADPRDRAATWGGDIFGQELSDDLASILKLSGAEKEDS